MARMRRPEPPTGTSRWCVLAPGAGVPAHSHSLDEECLALEGEVFLNDPLLRPGDYQCALAGGRHFETYSDVGALMFVRGAVETVYG